jgi:predicted RNA-binding protein YlxR (DUF448 family)
VTAEPVRTCIGCGERSPQGSLVRIVGTSEGLRADPERRAPGRGGYLHRRVACWEAFVGRRGRIRSLGFSPGRPERERLVAALAAAGSAEAAR